MRYIDVSEWKEFRVGDLFEGSTGKSHTLLVDKDSFGTMPYVSSTNSNNGINGYINDYAESEIVQSPALSVGSRGNDAITFYQNKDFVPSNNVTVLKTSQKIPKNAYLFLSTIITRYHDRFNYKNIMSQSACMNLKIKLPTKTIPDFRVISEIIRAGGYLQ